ncbi:MAG: uracil-DNA glycosylase [Janthinobacterium lividum]
MTPAAFVEGLASLRFPDVFNPYADACPDHDVAEAPSIRRRNLTLVVEAAISGGVDAMWVARDLGYRGGRRTGLALTDDVHLASHAGLYGRLPLERATRGPAVAERTAAIVWRVLAGMGRPVFLWNVFPLHPHGASSALTNRAHTRKEREAASHLMRWLLTELRPRTLVAIGRDAQAAVAQLGVGAEAVRHPSYGGQGEFLTQMSALYGPCTRAAPATQLTLC